MFSNKFARVLAGSMTAAGIIMAQPFSFDRLSALAAAEPAEQTTGVTDTEIVLGSCAPLTGQQKIRGSQVVAGGNTYFQYINEKGGINGRKIKLISGDDQYKTDVAVDCFNKNLKGKIFAGTLFMGTAVSAKWIAISDAQHIPMVGFSTGGQFIVEPVHKYVFQIRASYYDEAGEMIKSLWNKAKFRKMAIVYQDDAFGKTCRDGLVKGLRDLNAAPCLEVPFERLATNTEAVLKQVAASAPDVVLVGGGGDFTVDLIKHMRANNVNVATFSSSSDLLTKEAGKAADGTLVTQVLPFTRSELPTVQLFKKLYAKYQHEEPTVSGFEGFLIAMAVVEGLKKTGKDLSRDKFVSALESIHNADIGLGPQYRLNFDPTMHDGLRGAVTWTIVKDGAITAFDDWKRFAKK
jgi:branched-chain amino acid transport system substrate-binding protein